MRDNNNPLVSVIIPCYNSEKFIAHTVESLLGQTYKNLQIVCVNDGSTDSTQALLENLVRHDRRVEALHKQNGGVESALKLGLQQLKGDFIFPLGHDDTLSPDAIEAAVKAFCSRPELDAVRVDLKFVFDDPAKNFIMNDRRVLSGKEAFLETIGAWNIHTFCLWRSAVFQKVKEVDAGGAFNFDELATRYLYLHCREVGYCNGVYHYFQHEQSVTKKVSIRRLQALRVDALLRGLLADAGLYGAKAAVFEQYALQNIVVLGTLFFSIRPLGKGDKLAGQQMLREAFAALNRTEILAPMPAPKKLFWAPLLSSFPFFLSYLKLRHLYHKAKH